MRDLGRRWKKVPVKGGGQVLVKKKNHLVKEEEGSK
jgi:hypothetical protein